MPLEEELIEAISQGNTEKVENLIAEGADFRADTDHAFRLAAKLDKFEIVELLLEKGADIHACEEEALCYTVKKGRRAMTRLLLEKGADIEVGKSYPLYIASFYDQLDIVDLLLQKGANVHSRKNSALFWAIYNNNPKMVELVLRYDANPGYFDSQVITASFLRVGNLKPSTRNKARKNLLLVKFRRGVFSAVGLFLFHIFYRPGGLGFYQAVGHH